MNLPNSPEGPFSLAAISFITLSISCLPVPAAIMELVVLYLCSTVTPYEYALGISALSVFTTLVALGSVVSRGPLARRDGTPAYLGQSILDVLAAGCWFVTESFIMLFCGGVALGVDMFVFVVHDRLVPALWRCLKFTVLSGIPALLMHVWGLFIVSSAAFELLRRRTCIFGGTVFSYAYSKLSWVCKVATSLASRTASGISTTYDKAALRISVTCSVLFGAYSLLLEKDGKFKLASLPFRDAPTATTASRILSTFATPHAAKTDIEFGTKPSVQTVAEATASIPSIQELVMSAEDGTSSIEKTLPSPADSIPGIEASISDPVHTIAYVPEPIVLEDGDNAKAFLSVTDGHATSLIHATTTTPKPEQQRNYGEANGDIVDEHGVLTPITAPHNAATVTVTTTTITKNDSELDVVRIADVSFPADLSNDLEEANLPCQHEVTSPFEIQGTLPLDDSTTSTCGTEDDWEFIEIDEMQAAPVLRTNVAPALLYEPPRIPISISLDSYLDQKAIEIPSAAHPSASVKPLFASRTSGTPLTKSEDTGATVDGTEATTKEPECARPLTLNPERVFVPRAHAPSFTPRSQVPPPSTRLSPETRPFHPPQVKQTPQACTSMQTATPPTISIPHQPLINAPPMLLPARASPKNPPPFWAPRPAFPSDAQASTFVPRATAPVFAPQPPAPTQLPTAFPPSVLPPLPFLPRIQAPVFIPKALPTLSAPVFAPRPDAPSFVPRAQVPTFTFVPRLQAPVFVPGAVADKDAAELACAEPPAPTGEAAGGDEDEEGKRRKKKKTRRGGKRAQKQRQRRQAAMRAKAEAKAEAKARATAAVKSGREAGDVSSLSDKRSWAEEVEAAEDEDAESEVEIILELRAVRQVESVEASGLSA